MFGKILVPLDGSSLAECVLPHLVALTKAFDAQIILLQVLESETEDGRREPVDPLAWRMRHAEAESYLEEVADRLRAVGVDPEMRFLEGPPAQRIIEFTHEAKVDLVLLSSHGRTGLSRWNVSSVVQKIIQRANVSSMIVRAYRPTSEALDQMSYEQLLVPLDGSRRAECVLPTAEALARAHGASLELAHVVRRPEMPRRGPLTEEEKRLREELVTRNREAAEKYLAELRERIDVTVRVRLEVNDDITDCLHQLAEEQEADLIIVSAHGYAGKRKWPYGSVATSFITYGATPLLIIQDLPPAELEPTEAEIAAKEHKGH